VPSSYDANTPLALTFAWHGRTNPNTRVRTYYKVYEAAAGGTIMVYPAALSGGWKVDRDVAVFDQLLKEFSENYCVDLDRVYVVGHSLGSWFTNSLACARGDVVRASGSLGGGTTNMECSGPVAAITMHNPKDDLSPFSDGIKARDLHLKQNACGTATVNYSSPAEAHCVLYTDCAPDAPVVWCPHTEDHSWGDYYPHGWPRWTGAEIWSFFQGLDEV
jgi:polyhydroxybutyrate depolymerase